MSASKHDLLTSQGEIGTTITSLSFPINVIGGSVTIQILTDSQVGDITLTLQASNDGITFANVESPDDSTAAVTLTKAEAWADSKAWVINDFTEGSHYRFVITGGTSGTIESLTVIS